MQENQEMNFDKFIELMNLQIQAAIKAAGRKAVAVMGVTGSGKSTFLNYLLGRLFKLEEKDDNTIQPTIMSGEAVCEMGTGTRSCTLYPQIIEMPGEDYVIVDLPGFKDTRGDLAVRMCAAAAPHMVNQTLKYSGGKVKALVWVMSAHVTEKNGSDVREMLKYFSNIAQGDIKNIMRSLVIVVSKANNAATPEGIIRRLEAIVRDAEVGQFTPNEIVIFNEIIKNIKNKIIPFVVSRIDDKGVSANLIRQAIKSKEEPLSPESFDFSNYSDELKHFNKELIEKADIYVRCYRELQQANERLITKSQILNKESTSLEKISAASDALEDALNEKERELKILSDEYIRNQAIIDNIDKMTDLVPVHVIDQQRLPQTVVRVEEDKFPHGSEWAFIGHRGTAVVNGARFDKEKKAAGFNTQYIWNGRRRFKILATKNIEEPVPGTGEVNLRFESTYPVVVNMNNKVLTGIAAQIDNESCSQGYSARVRYSIGNGFHARITVLAQAKYIKNSLDLSVDARKKLDSLKAKIKQKSDEIQKLKSDLADNNSKRDKVSKEIKAISKDIGVDKETIKKVLLWIRNNLTLLSKVFNVVRYFDLDKKFKSAHDFVKCFDPSMPIDEILSKLNSDESEQKVSPESARKEKKNPEFQAKYPKKNVNFWSEANRHFVDRHFYTDEEIDVLIRNYLQGDVNSLIFDACTVGHYDAVQGLDGYLRHHQPAINLAATQRQRVYLPVNLGNFHWILVVLDYSQGKDSVVIHVVDPMGAAQPEVKRLVKLGLGLPETVAIRDAQYRYQSDGFNCGPWVVELAKFYAQQGRFPSVGDININAKRNEHQPIYEAAMAENLKP